MDFYINDNFEIIYFNNKNKNKNNNKNNLIIKEKLNTPIIKKEYTNDFEIKVNKILNSFKEYSIT